MTRCSTALMGSILLAFVLSVCTLAHRLQKDEDGNYPEVPVKANSAQDPTLDLDLEYYDQDSAGFLRVTVTKETLTIDSFSVPFEGAFEDKVRDTVTVTRDGRLNAPRGRTRRH